VSARYTSNPDGTRDMTPRGVAQMYKPGIDLPHVAHNVVAIDFEVVTEKHELPRCGCRGTDAGAGAGLVVIVFAFSRRRQLRAVDSPARPPSSTAPFTTPT
jgi:MYXO-CTERM domain-containing protein